MNRVLLALTFLVALIALGVAVFRPSNSVPHKQTAYERVLQTRTIRCAYMIWPPIFSRDPNTGKLGGLTYEMMEAVARSLNLKVDWATEIAPGTQVESLQAGKADAICGAEGTLIANAALHLAYTEPFAFFPIYTYVRPDDTRFGSDNERVNAEDVKVSVIDGDISREILNNVYTKAKPVSLPQLSDASQMMMDVVSKKADVVLNDDFSMLSFVQNNPGKLRKVSNKAIAVVPTAFSALRTELPLADMLSQGIKNIRDRGIEELILKRYGFDKNSHAYTGNNKASP